MKPYNLNINVPGSEGFYSDLERFTNNSLYNITKKYGSTVRRISDWFINQSLANLSDSEISLEFVMVGIYLQNYASKALNTGVLKENIFTLLYQLRKNNPGIKSKIDKIRGILAYWLLENRKLYRIYSYEIKHFINVLHWMKATGEFNEEHKRMLRWKEYLLSLTQKEADAVLKSAYNVANEFTQNGKLMLGAYTFRVNQFRNNALHTYKFREDYFFVMRHENEYFLNMFGAEIMNRELRNDYSKTTSKNVLIPTCMRNVPEENCKAQSDEKGKFCTQCNVDCPIGKAARNLKESNVKVYLISHSSSFSNVLKNWENQQETGLVGVACILNLLTGGYEMRRLGIPSQCVFLDCSSCKKHWDKEGKPTGLNINMLKSVCENSIPGKILNYSKIQPENTLV